MRSSPRRSRWNVAGLAGATAALAGSLMPSMTLALWASRWGAQRAQSVGVRAFTAGMAPLTIGLLLATCLVLTEPARSHPAALLLVPFTVVVMLRTKLSPLWPIAVGAVAGGFGLAG